MSGLDILDYPIPDHETARERYRDLAARPVMPDPRSVPFDPRPARFAIRTIVQFAAVALFLGAIWALFWNAA